MSSCNCLGNRIEEYLNTLFEKLGILIHDRPWNFFFTGLFLSSLAGIGLINAHFENDIIELYTPHNPTTEFPQNIYNEYIQSKQIFHLSLESTLMLILSPKTGIDTNIFSTNGLNEAWSAYNRIYSLNTSTNYTYFNSTNPSQSLCSKDPSTLICDDSPINFFALTFMNDSTNTVDPSLWQTDDQINSGNDLSIFFRIFFLMIAVTFSKLSRRERINHKYTLAEWTNHS